MQSGCAVNAAVVVEPKICEKCGTTFYRIKANPRRLANGTVIDPNAYCTKCEHGMAKDAKIDSIFAIRMGADGEVVEREREDRYTINRMERECLRKHAFLDGSLAMKTAERMRRRGRKSSAGGREPAQAYVCRVPIDWTQVDPARYPDHACKHWHIGHHVR